MKNTFQRSAAAIIVAVVAFAVSATAVNAAALKPIPFQGRADAQALKVKLTLPGVDQLKATLAAAGLPVSGLPNTGVAGVTLEQIISLDHATSVNGTATGFAAPLSGQINRSISTSCSKSSCSDTKSDAAVTVKLLDPAVPGGIGTLEVAGAKSSATSPKNITNSTALATLNVNLAKLIGKGGALSAVGDALSTLTKTINDTVLPAANSAVTTLQNTLGSVLPKEVADALGGLVKTGTINNLPDLTTADLVNLTVLGGRADITSNANSINSISESKVADISVLDKWITIKGVTAATNAWLDLKKHVADATRNLSLTDIKLGGLLSISSPEAPLLTDAAVAKVQKTLRDGVATAPDAVKQKVEDVIAALDILYNSAGIRIERINGLRDVLNSGAVKSTVTKLKNATAVTRTAAHDMKASATSDMLRLIVEPKIPLVKNGVTPAGALVPRLGKDDYVSSGIALEVDLPQTSSAVAQGSVVLGTRISRTGVGIQWMAVAILMGAAVLVRKFVLSK